MRSYFPTSSQANICFDDVSDWCQLMLCMQSSSPDAAAYQMPASPFSTSHYMPRAHSAYVPSRAHAFSDAGLVTAESAPQGLQPLIDADEQAGATPKKAGRLQLLKLRVAVCFLRYDLGFRHCKLVHGVCPNLACPHTHNRQNAPWHV